MSQAEYLQALARAFRFMLEELSANQRGELTPEQLARGRRKGGVGVLCQALLGLAFLVGGLTGAGLWRDSLGPKPSQVDANLVVIFAVAGVLLAALCLLLSFRGHLRRRKRMAAFSSGRIDVLEGAIDKQAVRGAGGSYSFRVRGRTFLTSRRPWELLTQGAVYRLHCVDDVLLSLAPVVEDSIERSEFERESGRFEQTRRIAPSSRVG